MKKKKNSRPFKNRPFNENCYKSPKKEHIKSNRDLQVQSSAGQTDGSDEQYIITKSILTPNVIQELKDKL